MYFFVLYHHIEYQIETNIDKKLHLILTFYTLNSSICLSTSVLLLNKPTKRVLFNCLLKTIMRRRMLFFMRHTVCLRLLSSFTFTDVYKNNKLLTTVKNIKNKSWFSNYESNQQYKQLVTVDPLLNYVSAEAGLIPCW